MFHFYWLSHRTSRISVCDLASALLLNLVELTFTTKGGGLVQRFIVGISCRCLYRNKFIRTYLLQSPIFQCEQRINKLLVNSNKCYR